MNKREMSLYGIFCIVAIILVTWVCVYTWGYDGLLLAGKLISAVFNLVLLGVVLHFGIELSRKSERGRYIAYVKSVLTFWKMAEYLQAATRNRSVKQDGSGLVNMVPEYDKPN